MPRAAYCSDCGRYVWIAKDGGCIAGHPRSSLRDEQDMAQDAMTGHPIASPNDDAVWSRPDDWKSAATMLKHGVVVFVGSAGVWLQRTAAGLRTRSESDAQRSQSRDMVPLAAIIISVLCVGVAAGAVLGGKATESSVSKSSAGATTTRRQDSTPRSYEPAQSNDAPTSYERPSSTVPRSYDPAPYVSPSNNAPRSYEPAASELRSASRCTLCGGLGTEKCILCRGTGRRGECVSCQGTGRGYNGACFLCDGLGQQACISCDGSGRKVCISCDGAGVN